MITDDEVEALKARLRALEEKDKPPEEFKREPWQRYDATAGMALPASAIRSMTDNVSDRELAAIRRDHAGAMGPRSVLATEPSTVPVIPSQNGWIEPTPLKPPVGVEICDGLMDEADRRDKLDLVQKLRGR